MWPIKSFEKHFMAHQYMPKIFHDPHKTPSPPPPLYLMYVALYIVKTVIWAFWILCFIIILLCFIIILQVLAQNNLLKNKSKQKFKWHWGMRHHKNSQNRSIDIEVIGAVYYYYYYFFIKIFFIKKHTSFIQISQYT